MSAAARFSSSCASRMRVLALLGTAALAPCSAGRRGARGLIAPVRVLCGHTRAGCRPRPGLCPPPLFCTHKGPLSEQAVPGVSQGRVFKGAGLGLRGEGESLALSTGGRGKAEMGEQRNRLFLTHSCVHCPQRLQ